MSSLPASMAASSVGRRLGVEVDPGDGRLGALEDDVLGLLDVESARAQVLEDVGQDARPIAMADDQHVGRRRPPREVHDVRDLAGLLERADDADGLGRDRLLRLFRGRADVVGAVHPGLLQQRHRELGGPGGRLVGIDVEAHPQAAVADGGQQRRRGRRPRPGPC